MPENDRTQGRKDVQFTGADGLLPDEQPVRTSNERLPAGTRMGEVIKPVPLATENDEFGRTPEQMAELNKKREKAFEAQDKLEDVRNNHIDALADVHNTVRDRTLAVQEEIATRERDGAMPGTPAFERRKARIRDIAEKTGNQEQEDDANHADRLQVIAASLHTMSPGGIEVAQRELMQLASEMRGDADGSKAAEARAKRVESEREQSDKVA
jgi:hypothetical protein